MPGEFTVIQRYFAPLTQSAPQVVLGIGDDCALIQLAPGQQLALSIDTLVEGVHFLPEIDPEDLAWRLLGASVSDLAAMGAEPLNYTLALTLPEISEPWLEKFAKGLGEAAGRYQIPLVGGDTTSGRTRVLSAQVQGAVPAGQALTRGGAQPGDLIVVSGTLGDSRAGLALLSTELDGVSEAERDYLLQRFLRPTPRLALGIALRELATAAIDISDGLLADLGHILERSSCTASLDLDRLPISTALRTSVDQDTALRWAATGGEDFELCFTLPAAERDRLAQISQRLGLALTVIGEILGESDGADAGSPTRLKLHRSGTPCTLNGPLGFDHFG